MIIIDASVANKYFLASEQDHKKVQVIFKNHLEEFEEILVPDLLFIEVANTLSTKTSILQSKVKESLEILYQIHLTTYRLLEEDLIEAAILAKDYETTVYDMIYAVIAKKHKVTLVTADQKFINQTGFKFLKLLSDL